MCKIHILKNGKSGTGTGFFCSLKHSNLNLNIVLLTNNHVLDEDNLKEGNVIEYECGNEIINQIKITKERRVFTNKDLDYSCIEIFDNDKILNYFEINDDIMNGNFEKIIKSDIFILQYPKGGEISFSQGNIIKIIEDRIIHSASTEEGSSGSPIILRNNQYNYKICGIHFGGNESKNCNFATTLNKIINDIETKANQISFDKVYLTIETNQAFENIILLNDGRISGCTNDGQVIIYNKEKYDKIDLTINAFKNNPIFYLTQLKNGHILACSNSIKIIKLKLNFFYKETYEIVQKLEKNTQHFFNKVIALDENRLISSLNDSSIIFYKKDNNNKFCYSKMFFIGDHNEYPLERTNLLKINDNEFVATSRKNECAVFFIGGDSIMKNEKIDNIKTNGYPNSMLIHNSILLIGGDTDKGIYLINTKSYSLISNIQINFKHIHLLI